NFTFWNHTSNYIFFPRLQLPRAISNRNKLRALRLPHQHQPLFDLPQPCLLPSLQPAAWAALDHSDALLALVLWARAALRDWDLWEPPKAATKCNRPLVHTQPASAATYLFSRKHS